MKKVTIIGVVGIMTIFTLLMLLAVLENYSQRTDSDEEYSLRKMDLFLNEPLDLNLSENRTHELKTTFDYADNICQTFVIHLSNYNMSNVKMRYYYFNNRTISTEEKYLPEKVLYFEQFNVTNQVQSGYLNITFVREMIDGSTQIEKYSSFIEFIYIPEVKGSPDDKGQHEPW